MYEFKTLVDALTYKIKKIFKLKKTQLSDRDIFNLLMSDKINENNYKKQLYIGLDPMICAWKFVEENPLIQVKNEKYITALYFTTKYPKWSKENYILVHNLYVLYSDISRLICNRVKDIKENNNDK